MQQKTTTQMPAKFSKVGLAAVLWLLCYFSPVRTEAQNWILPYCSSLPSATTSNLYGPMYSTATTNSTNRIAIIYPASQLTTIANSTINALYFHKATATSAMLGNPSFKIYLKTVAAADWGTAALDWATEIASATLVYNGNPVSAVGTAVGWKGFTLSSGFYYSGAQNLAVMLEYTNPNSSNAIVWSYEYTSTCVNTANNNTTKYTNNTTGTLPATLNTSNYRRPYIGFDITYPPCAGASNLPTAGTIGAMPTTLCVSGNVNLTFNPSTAMPNVSGITYIWQSSPNNATWTDIATTTVPSYTVTGLSASTWYRVKMLCGTTTLITTASQQIVVNNPGTVTAIPATRCGPGSLTLGATPPAGSSVNWYQNATGGGPLAMSTNTYNTGYIPATTTFYAAAVSGTSPATQWVGTATTTLTGTPSPYYTTFYGNKEQYLIKASELIAAGLSAGMINSIGFDVTTQSGTVPPLSQYRIAMANTTVNALTTTFETGLTTVLAPTTYNIVPNAVNTHTLTTPFYWDGSSNLLIETCFNNTTWSGSTTVRYSNYTYAASHYQYADDPNQCAVPTGTNGTTTNRPNIQFGMTLSCIGPRVPVTATVTPPPAVTKTAPAVVCNNAVTTIAVASAPMSNYTTYGWTPATNLYTNAAATTPYVAGSSAPTVYMKSNVVGQNVYYLYATGNTPASCAYADTVRIWVQPDSVWIKGQPDTICYSGSTTLSLVPATGYAPNTIQWQQSTNGVTYTDITGATGVSYVTPVLTANRYYKAIIKSTNDITCQSPVKYVVVAAPALASVADSFHCGPGTVTLTATSTGNSTARWYDVPTLGLPLASGSTFTTPYLGATTTYYVEASAGGSSAPPTWIGTATTSTTAEPNPFYTTFWGNKVQMMIRASELQAAGFMAGTITKLGFDLLAVASGTPALTNFTIQAKNATVNDLAAGFETTGFQTVYTTASYVPTPNAVNEFTFGTPFVWDGTSNIVIQTCFNNSTWSGSTGIRYSSPGFTASRYYYADASTVCTGNSAGFTATTRPNMRITMTSGCASPRQAVTAYIHPTPSVDLGPDINKCVDAGAVEVLDAGVQQHTPQYLWDNGSTSQVRAVTQSGTYSVRVTNQYTCYDEDTVVINLRRNPVVRLGNDTTVCNGVMLPLNAGPDGVDYFWSTGQTSQSIVVNSPGSYNVFVTNSLGCVKADTIVVNMNGELPTIQGISVSNNGINTFHFTAVNPQNVIGYEWDFGDNTPHSYQASPSHTYADAGNYIVTLHLSSTCGFDTDSTSAHIVGIHQLNVSNEELTVFPNPARATVTILNKGALKMESVSLYNVLGQVVYQAKADSKEQHTISLERLASGVYTIQVFTDKGTVARKLEIVH